MGKRNFGELFTTDRQAWRAGQVSPTLEKFKYLSRRTRPASPDELRLIQDELYYLAQVITIKYWPSLYSELKHARQQFMHLLHKHKASLDGHIVAPHPRKAWRERWFDHQVTPEVTRDPAMSGLIVPRELSKRLIRLHKEQIAALTDLIARS